MEKSGKQTHDSEPLDSVGIQVLGDEQQKSKSQIQNEQTSREVEEEANLTSLSLTGSEKCDQGRILRPQVKTFEESKQNISVGMIAAADIESEPVLEYEMVDEAMQATSHTRDVTTEKVCYPSETFSCKSTEADIEETISCTLAEGMAEVSKMGQKAVETDRVENIPDQIEKLNAQESDTCSKVEYKSERGEQSEQELPIQKAQQAMELVLEETAICDEKQPLEKAEGIDEPQKYAFREKKS